MATLNLSIEPDDLAESIATMEHKDIVKLFSLVLESAATVELDEEIVGRLWPIILGSYIDGDEEDLPTIDELVTRYSDKPI